MKVCEACGQFDSMSHYYGGCTGAHVMTVTALSCRHPFGCQAPGEGCYGSCPVTEAEAVRIETEYLSSPRPVVHPLADEEGLA